MKKFGYVEKSKLKLMPQNPGVYALSAGKKILYIGKAMNLQERVKNHFQRSSYRDNLFMDHIERIGYIQTRSEIDALLLESFLIKKQKPRYNVIWKDGKNYFYVSLTKEPFPRILITHQPSLSQKTLGPFVDGKALKQALKFLRHAFPYYTIKTHPKHLCSWCHIKLCPGPNPNHKEYKKNLANLFAVLQGKRTSVLKKIQKAMNEASREQRFEQAAVLRNQLFALENIVSHSQKPAHKKTSRNNAKYELQEILLSKNPIVRIEAYDISNIQGHLATGSMVTFLNGKPAKQWYRKFKIHITGKANDFAMMEELLSRRLTHKEWPYPDLILIDGGKGQLSSALLALRKYQTAILIAAIAKKHNELFLPGQSAPLLLKNMPSQAQNVLLHIRDEAHRFAITYHRKLRSRYTIPNN